MSEPVPRPDKLLARLISLAALVLLVGLCLRATDEPGGTASVGWGLLAAVVALVAYLGAIYRTRWWR